MRTASYICVSSREADSPEVASAVATLSASVGLLNWTGETLTATRTLSGQFIASAHAALGTQLPGWLIWPVSSATGMNSAGEIMPRSGWRHRSSASQEETLPSSRLTTG